VALDDPDTHRVALDKALVHQMLVDQALPVPAYAEFDISDTGTPLDFLRRSGTPCVIKPASGTSGGKGVAGGVMSPLELARARLSAARYGRRLLIERQVPGEMHRLLFLDGELLDVVRRRRPTVVGDGRSTIAELIARENRRRIDEAQRSGLIRIDLDCVFTLASQGLELESVPGESQTVIVKTASSENRVEDNETIREISSELTNEAAAAVRAVGLRLGGVDAVTPDTSRSLADAGGAIIEINGTPGLDYHYDVAEPARATRVAVPILQTLLDQGGNRQTPTNAALSGEAPDRPRA
jgi:cyanophycin synthetase